MTAHETEAKPMASLNQDLRDETEHLGKRAADRVRAQARAGQEKLRETGEHIGEQVRHTGDQIQDGMSTATRQGQDFVRENPGLALAGAFGLGLLIGVALRDRS